MRHLLLFFFCIYSFIANAQNVPLYSRAKIHLSTENTIEKLAQLGMEVDHGVFKKGRYYLSEFADYELKKIQEAGFEVEVQIPDLVEHLRAVNAGEIPIESLELKTNECDESTSATYDYQTPENFELGSMAGFYTLAEMEAILDDMATKFPNLITLKKPVDNVETHQGRPIHWLKISDNPNADEDEPEVLYTSLHHAREPNGLTQLIFYMWYLLENYETDPEIKFLVDNTEMYFMPCVNPDGYVYNETTNPAGGGFWRKNRRYNGEAPNGSDVYGVDLNRNYGYEWAYDDAGSSPNPQSDTYRGPEGFSEPETQAVRDFCNQHEFQIALNYHTFGNLLIYPWGFSDSPTPDGDIFTGFAKAMTRENDYLAGTGSETVGYTVNGDSDDWMYAEEGTKPKIYAMTPEAGSQSFGFWPPMGKIVEISKSCVLMNLTTAHLVHNFGLVTDLTAGVIQDLNSTIDFQLERYGLQEGDLTVSLTPLSDNVIGVGEAQIFNLDAFTTTESSINFEIAEDVETGEEIVLVLNLNNGVTTLKDTLYKEFLRTELLIAENGDNLDNFELASGTGSMWGITTADFFSEPSSITDSPDTTYQTNASTHITTKNSFDIGDSERLFLQFRTKFNIEDDYDYAQVLLSVDDGFSFIPLCGKYSDFGTLDQGEAAGAPVYDGIQSEWVLEEIDLTEYLLLADQPRIKIRFQMISDNFLELDGFYFDDLKLIVAAADEVNQVIELDNGDFVLKTYPNPAQNQVNIDLESVTPLNENASLFIYNSLGQLIQQEALTDNPQQNIKLNTADWHAGLYFYQIVIGENTLPLQRLVVAK